MRPVSALTPLMFVAPLLIPALAVAAAPGAKAGAGAITPGSPAKASLSQALTPEAALKVQWPKTAEISPDGKSVLVAIKDTNLEENLSATQLYLLPATGGEPRQLTFLGKSNSEPAWSPDGTRIAFVGNRDETPQIYLLDLQKGGEAKKLTDVPGGASGPIWSPDGSKIAFTSHVYPDCKDDACNKQRAADKSKSKVKAMAFDDLLYRHWNAWDEGTRSHIFVVSAGGAKPARDLTPGRTHAPSDTLSPGRGYAFAGNDTIIYCANVDKDRALSTNSDLFSVAVSGDAAARLLTSNKALDANPVPSPDGRYVAYVSFDRPGFEADRGVLTILDRTTGKIVRRSESFDRAVDEIAWAPDGESLFVTAYDRGYLALFKVGRDSGDVTPLIPKRSIEGLSISRDGTLAFVGSGLAEPPEVFVLAPADRAPKRISRLNQAVVDGNKLGKVDELEVGSGGVKVHGFITYPPDFKPSGRYPLVVLIHGGPQGAFANLWHPRWNAQLFAAKGWVVALPNFRGSVGYGQKFTDAVSKDWGGGPYEDVMAFTEAMAKKPFIEPRSICAAGASFGGYMVDWIAGHNQRFACLISHAGVFNIESMWGDTEELWFPEWELGGTPWASREMYRRWSPHEYIQNAKTPTLVIHGQLDYRVNVSQGQQMFSALKRLGVPARFVYFPDEGHFILKPQNYVYWYGEMLGWLGRYLK